MQTVESGLQNPVSFTDVNASGDITSLDALLIINRLAESGETSIPVGPDERGPNFFDVNGSLFISALDALLVINHIGEQAPLAMGEMVGQPIDAGMAASVNEDRESPPVDVVFDAAGAVASGKKLINAGAHDPVAEVDLIEQLVDAQDPDKKRKSEKLTDLALLDLS